MQTGQPRGGETDRSMAIKCGGRPLTAIQSRLQEVLFVMLMEIKGSWPFEH